METIEQKENKIGVMWAERSESIAKIAPALVKAQALVLNAKKDTTNTFFRSKYADLASVKEAMQEPFALNELAVLQEPQTENHNVCLVTTLIHSSGEFMRSKFVVPCKQDAQGYGSAVTYARRYALSALAGVAPEEDDGNEASGKDNGGQKPAAQQRPAPQSIAPSLKPADQLDGEMCTYHLSKYFEGKDFEFVKSMTAKLKKMGGKDMGKDVWKVPQYIEQLAVYYKSDKQAA